VLDEGGDGWCCYIPAGVITVLMFGKGCMGVYVNGIGCRCGGGVAWDVVLGFYWRDGWWVLVQKQRHLNEIFKVRPSQQPKFNVNSDASR